MKTLIIAEHNNEKLKTLTLNSITAASKISDDIEAIVIGHSINGAVEELKSCEKLKKIFAVDNEIFKNQLAEPMSFYLKEFLKENAYTHILAPSSTFGKNLMPKVATHLDVQQISDISNVIDGDIFERPIYAGNAIAKVRSHDKIKVITVRSTCFEACKTDSNNVEVVKSEIGLNYDLNVNFVGYELSKSDRPELTAAKIIISGGRGTQMVIILSY